jgi:hypothetical protein
MTSIDVVVTGRAHGAAAALSIHRTRPTKACSGVCEIDPWPSGCARDSLHAFAHRPRGAATRSRDDVRRGLLLPGDVFRAARRPAVDRAAGSGA